MKQLFLFFCIFTFKFSFAQTTINVSSHSATINGIIHDYSIGEMTVIITEKSSSLIVTQGLLQPSSSLNDKSNETRNDLSTLVDLVNVYPNPTNSIVNIELKTDETFQIQLFDALGKLVLEEKNTNNITKLDLSTYSNGNYYLVVTPANSVKEKQFFKIQKIN